MAKEIRCAEDLGIADCDLIVRDDVPGDIVRKVVDHLREEHDMTTPDADAIMEGSVEEEDVDEKVWTVVKRLDEELNLSDLAAQSEELVEGEGPAVAPKKQL
jgi:predicted small metal-binding protein